MDNLGPENESILEINLDGCNRKFAFYHPSGTFALTPASKTLIHAIIQNKDKLHGVGIDWGSGIGCLAIVAASLESVDKVYGLEISKRDVDVSYENAKTNQVFDKVEFFHSDSYSPLMEKDKKILWGFNMKVDFIISNPPSSEGDDGFGFRREVLKGGRTFLKKDGIVFLNISLQYGQSRIEDLVKDVEGYHYKGLLYSTEWVPFDLNREDLLHCLEMYKHEEENGGMEYTFKSADLNISSYINAATAYEDYQKTGKSPLTRWQTHLFQLI